MLKQRDSVCSIWDSADGGLITPRVYLEYKTFQYRQLEPTFFLIDMSSSTTQATEYAQAMMSLTQGLSFSSAGQFGQQWWDTFKPIFVCRFDDYSGTIVLTSPNRNFGSRQHSTNSRKIEPYGSWTRWYRNSKRTCRGTLRRSRAPLCKLTGSSLWGPIEMWKRRARWQVLGRMLQLFLFGRESIKRSCCRRKKRKRMLSVPSIAITRACRLSLNEDERGNLNKNWREVEPRLMSHRRQLLRWRLFQEATPSHDRRAPYKLRLYHSRPSVVLPDSDRREYHYSLLLLLSVAHMF